MVVCQSGCSCSFYHFPFGRGERHAHLLDYLLQGSVESRRLAKCCLGDLRGAGHFSWHLCLGASCRHLGTHFRDPMVHGGSRALWCGVCVPSKFSCVCDSQDLHLLLQGRVGSLVWSNIGRLCARHFMSSSRCPGVMSDFDLFVSSTGNFNVNTLNKMNIWFVAATGHFHNENCLRAWKASK